MAATGRTQRYYTLYTQKRTKTHSTVEHDYAKRRKYAFEFGAHRSLADMPISLRSHRRRDATVIVQSTTYTTVSMQLAATLCDCIVICISPSPIISHRKCTDDIDDDHIDEMDANMNDAIHSHAYFFEIMPCAGTHCASKVLTVHSWEYKTVEKKLWKKIIIMKEKRKKRNETNELAGVWGTNRTNKNRRF